MCLHADVHLVWIDRPKTIYPGKSRSLCCSVYVNSRFFFVYHSKDFGCHHTNDFEWHIATKGETIRVAS